MKQSYMQVGRLVLSRMPLYSLRITIDSAVPSIERLTRYRFFFFLPCTSFVHHGIAVFLLSMRIHSSLFLFLVAANMGVS